MPLNHQDAEARDRETSLGAAHPATDGAPSHALQAELVTLLYTQSAAGVLATVPIVLLAVAVLWSQVAPPLLLAWLCIALAVSAGRLSLIRRYRRHFQAVDAQHWEHRFLIAAAAGGAVWGLLGGMVGLVDTLVHRVFLVFVTGGMAAGAISTMNAGLTAYRVYAFTASAPAVVGLLLQGERIATTMALMVSVFILLLLRTARHVHRYVLRALNLGYENERLVESLSQSKTHVERANLSLAEEVRERRRREQRLRTQQAALVRLTSYETFRLGDTDNVLELITRTAAQTLEVRRASLWLYDTDGGAIEAVARHPPESDKQASLPRELAPEYFRALEQNLVIAAEDAWADPRTRELADKYLRPDGVGALLDAPIRLGGQSVGVLCLEHCGGRRAWTLEEQNFAAALAEMVALALDQHQRRQVEDALFREKERAQVTLESIADGVVTTDVTGHINYMNPVAAELTGWTQAQAVGRNLEDVLHLYDETTGARVEDLYAQVVGGDGHVCLPQELLLMHREGRRDFSIEVSAAPLRDRAQGLIGAVLVFHDITELRGMARLMSYQASHDALTALPNRREFEAQVEHALHSARQDGAAHALMYLDLDQFKVVNDTCGHIAGDELLRQVGSLLQGCIRDADLLARLGGDEFGVLLRNCTLAAAREVAEKMKQVVKEFRFAWEARVFDLGVSIGVVAVDSDSRDLAELLSAADAACYVAKDEGRNRVHVYLPDDAVTARRHGEMQWVHRINRAIAEDRLHLYYQPIVALTPTAREPSGCEVLIRMVDEDGELVLPMAFIPAAERYQMMTALDRWVVQSVLAALGNGGSPLDRFELCSINLSAQSLCDDQFLPHLLEVIATNGVDPQRLCFEITETAVIANFPHATRLIDELRKRGCRFALDDFGSGLSSFAYLKTLDVDFIKIDGEFVRDIARDPVDYAMVAAINQLGHVMGKKTIAEYVEDAAVMKRLNELGVDYAQGYGIARPEPLHAVACGGFEN